MATTVQMGDHTRQERDHEQSPAGILLTVLGTIMILAGALMLLYLGFMVVGILKDPNDMKLVSLVFEQIQKGERAFFGVFGENKVEFELGEPLRTLIFVVLVIWLLGAFAGIINTIISAGRELVVAGREK